MDNQDILSKGIYCIQNKINGKRYVGKTSVNFKKRWRSHKLELRRGIHKNCHLQNSWISYGEGCFEFLVLEIVSEKEDITNREQYWMDFYKVCDDNFGYNIKPKADHSQHSEETKKKIGKANTGRYVGEKNYKSTITWEIRDEIVKFWNEEEKTVKEISEVLKVREGVIRGIISGANWIDEKRIRLKGKSRKKHVSQETKEKIKELYREGELSQRQLAKKLDVSQRTVCVVLELASKNDEEIRKNLNEKRKFATDEKKVAETVMLIKNGITQQQISKKLGISVGVISRISSRFNLFPKNEEIKKEIIRLYEEENYSQRELSRVFNYSSSGIGHILRNNIIPSRSRIDEEIKRKVVEYNLTGKYTLQHIATKFNISVTSVCKILKQSSQIKEIYKSRKE